MTLSFRWMNTQDIPQVSALAQRIWNAHYPGIISQQQIDYMLNKNYSAESLTNQLGANHQFMLALQNHIIIGFLSVAPLSTVTDPVLRGNSPFETDYFLQKFYVAPEAQGAGIGKQLLGHVINSIPHITRLRLQVARKNTASWNFYLRQGFTIEQEADFAIGNGFYMEDYVMEKVMFIGTNL